MSASEPTVPPAPSRSRQVPQRIRRIIKTSWGTLRQSRLGVIGFVIVMVFAAMAILAPVIAPYPRLFEAPVIDRYEIGAYSAQLPKNQTYGGPVMGPTTPFLVDAGGGMWQVNWNATGAFVYMNFLRYTLTSGQTPYTAGNLSMSFDATQYFNAVPLPGTPLRQVYWVVPSMNASIANRSMGVTTRNGALALFMGHDFMFVDPFARTVIYRYTLPFNATWTGEDPESSGDLQTIPTQNGYQLYPGTPITPYGPYHYFYASDGNHTIVFEVTWVHTGDATPGSTPGGRVVVWSNTTLSAPPFTYYYWQKTNNANKTGFREGAGQAIILPLANASLAVYNVTGVLRSYVPLTLSGEPATVVSPIGFSRSTDTPSFLIYLNLQSQSHAALATFDMGTLRIFHTYELGDRSLQLMQAPVSYDGSALYVGYFNAASDSTQMIGLKIDSTRGNLTTIPQWQLSLPGRIRDYFFVSSLFSVYVYTQARTLIQLPTTFGSGVTVITPQDFGLRVPSDVNNVVYAGTFHGTLYSVALTQNEVNGAFTDSASGNTTVFTLLGKPRVPLAPGTYPSGNYYPLGTDYTGHDILTQLLYGTQVAFIVGLLAALFGVGIGTFVGVIAGYYGKMIDTLLMRTTDVFLVLPFLPIVLVLVSIVKPSIWIIIFVVAILTWPGIARVIRAQVLSLKERAFVDAARVAGASDSRLIFLHITPNVLPFSFLFMSLGVAGAIITEAALSYLGLGDPSVTSWGGMLSTLITLGGALNYPWWLLPPGLAITFLCLGFYLLGRGFDEIINPRLRRR